MFITTRIAERSIHHVRSGKDWPLENYILVLLLTQDILGLRSIFVLLVTVPSLALLRFGFFRDLVVSLFVVFDLKDTRLANDLIRCELNHPPFSTDKTPPDQVRPAPN